MTEVLHSSSPSSPSASPPTISTPTHTHTGPLFQAGAFGEEEGEAKGGVKERDQLSLLALLVTLFRKSFWLACKTDRAELCATGGGGGGGGGMEIGWPTNVRHVAHVTFDRFNGFLGLPVEFEPEVPRRAPSASATVFGVSTESMQLSFDSRGNSVPTILLLMQRRLYAQRGLQAEGIFRINAENSQEEYVREQLNRGVVPEGIDVHCLAGLIKAWFRELPSGVLDSLSQEQVIQCQSEEDCTTLVRLLPTTEAALLDWAINLMADVVQEEHLNKMNARNIAMVFAPNMTQMADPLTALMYAVQVMNFLKTLIEKTLRDRKDSVVEPAPVSNIEPYGEDGHQNPPQFVLEETDNSAESSEQMFTIEDPYTESLSDSNPVGNLTDEEYLSYSVSTEESEESGSSKFVLDTTTPIAREVSDLDSQMFKEQMDSKLGQSSDSNQGKGPAKTDLVQQTGQSLGTENKCKGISNLSRINSMTERIEAWR